MEAVIILEKGKRGSADRLFQLELQRNMPRGIYVRPDAGISEGKRRDYRLLFLRKNEGRIFDKKQFLEEMKGNGYALIKERTIECPVEVGKGNQLLLYEVKAEESTAAQKTVT